MSREENLRADIQAASKAEELKAALEPHLKALEAQYIDKWKQARTTEEREDAWYRVQGLYGFAVELRTVIERGSFAKANLPRS